MSVSPTEQIERTYAIEDNISRKRNTVNNTPAAVSEPEIEAKSALGDKTQPDRLEQQALVQLEKQAVILLQMLDGQTIFVAYATILASFVPMNQSHPKKLFIK